MYYNTHDDIDDYYAFSAHIFTNSVNVNANTSINVNSDSPVPGPSTYTTLETSDKSTTLTFHSGVNPGRKRTKRTLAFGSPSTPYNKRAKNDDIAEPYIP